MGPLPWISVEGVRSKTAEIDRPAIGLPEGTSEDTRRLLSDDLVSAEGGRLGVPARFSVDGGRLLPVGVSDRTSDVRSPRLIGVDPLVSPADRYVGVPEVRVSDE